MDKFNSLTANEQVYVHTDCEVYAPGDTIWFKAYIRNKASLERANLSRIFYINLVSEYGKIVKNEKFVITNAQSNGQLIIGRDMESGNYTLLCYSSWMKNFDPEGVYQKEILIEPEFTEGLRYVPHFDRNNYQPGDTVKIVVKCYDKLNNQKKGSRFRYRVSVDERIFERGTGVTSEIEYPITIIIPDSMADIPELYIWDGISEASYDVPVNAKIHVDFFPEGGQCLMNEIGNVAFKAVYMSGEPAVVFGDIVDEQGIKNYSVKSDHDGMGRFMYFPKNNSKSFLRIT